MDWRKRLYRIYTRVERLLVPGLEYSQYQYERVLDSVVRPDDAWLDLGCGHQVLPEWRRESERGLALRSGKLVGLDIELDALRLHRSLRSRVKGDIARLPFRANHFRLVTANMVVEHLSEPEAQFREILRVLRPGGHFVFHTPNALGYSTLLSKAVPEFAKKFLIRLLEGRAEEDVFRTHYLANTRRHVVRLAMATGFEAPQIEMITSAALSAIVLPLAVVELLWLRLLRAARFQDLRPNMIVRLRKPLM